MHLPLTHTDTRYQPNQHDQKQRGKRYSNSNPNFGRIPIFLTTPTIPLSSFDAKTRVLRGILFGRDIARWTRGVAIVIQEEVRGWAARGDRGELNRW